MHPTRPCIGVWNGCSVGFMQKMTSLAEQISNLANPTPVFEDPEELHEGARLTEKDVVEEDSVEVGASRLRQKQLVNLSEFGSRYGGEQVSRSRLGDDNSASDEQNELTDDSDLDEAASSSDDEDFIKSDGEESGAEDNALSDFQNKLKERTTMEKGFSFQDGGNYAIYGDDNESDNDKSADDEEVDVTESDDEEDGMQLHSDKDGVQSFSQTSVQAEVEKGCAVRSQIGLWDSVMEGRISLQRALVLVNKLPQPSSWQHFINATGDEYKTGLQESQKLLLTLLERLVTLQSLLYSQHPDTCGLLSAAPLTTNRGPAGADDEVTSESEEEGRGASVPVIPQKRKLKPDQYPEFLTKRHKAFHIYRNDTIQKWFDKTRVASGKLNKGFGAFDQSALRQIEQILADRERLVRRTQLRRSTQRPLGQLEPPTDTTQAPQAPDEPQVCAVQSVSKDYDEEIFDDDDFYHQLLRELIQQKTTDVTDPVALSRQWLEVQKLRRKVKKKVDTKASKGRKIRYDVHQKLVNFMAPVDSVRWSEQAKSELYKSLFGKTPEGATSTDAAR